MVNVFYANLQFEEELTAEAATSAVLSPQARRLVAELAPVTGFLSKPTERSIVLVDADSIPGDVPDSLAHVEFATIESARTVISKTRSLHFRPWGWSQAAESVARQLGVACKRPKDSVVQFVNSREFLVERDFIFDEGTHRISKSETFSKSCRSTVDVQSVLTSWQSQGIHSWVIKANHSQAARNRIVGRGGALSEPHQRWLEKQLRAAGCIAIEPWVERISEFGLQFTIGESDSSSNDQLPELAFDGFAEMLTDPLGRYCGSWLSETYPHWIEPAIQHCRRIAADAAALGYFGPIGFDCMQFKNPVTGESQVRLCHDVNARNTMGRIAISLARLLSPGESAIWLHAQSLQWTKALENLKTTGQDLDPVNEPTSQDVRIVPTSPAITGSQPTQLKTALLISADRTKLETVARQILWQTSGSPSNC